MKVLWITNIMLPAISNAINRPSMVFGGWLEGSANALKEKVNLSIATTYDGNNIVDKEIDGIRYFLLPSKAKMYKYDPALEKLWMMVSDLIKPDIVHIHGTEYPYGLAYIKACGNSNVVISLQGILSECAKHYFDGISLKDRIKNFRPWSFYFGLDFCSAKRSFQSRSISEKKLLLLCENFAGRTTWDKSIVCSVNPTANYYEIGEALRKSFYTGSWNYDDCNKYTIFISQAGYPIKGFHLFLKALCLVKNKYPHVQVRIAGPDITQSNSLKSKLLQSDYGRMISDFIDKHNLRENINFLGLLSEDRMRSEYLSANVFVSPSSLENSPNSLAEAQILGTPCVASFVGGVSNMVEHGKTGYLYRFEDYVVLANYISDIFDCKYNLQELSINERACALIRHDKEAIIDAILSMYGNIIENSNHIE